MPGRKLLVSWLKDAHAMEEGLVPVLKDHAKHAENHPEVRSRLQLHLEETRRHADLVEECLRRLDSDSSGGKDFLSKMMTSVQGKLTRPAEDTLVKDSLQDFAVEHFEIASYKALIKAAETLGEQEIASTCREILREEEEMAEFLDRHLSPAVEAAI